MSAICYAAYILCKKIKNDKVRGFLSKVFHETIIFKGLVSLFRWTIKPIIK